MKLSFLKRGSQWPLTLLVLAVVVVAGGRLIALSVGERAEQMRATAGTLVTTYSRSIERQLQTLAARDSGARFTTPAGLRHDKRRGRSCASAPFGRCWRCWRSRD